MGKTKKDGLFGSNVQPRRIVNQRRTDWNCEECGRWNAAHLVQCSRCGAYQ